MYDVRIESVERSFSDLSLESDYVLGKLPNDESWRLSFSVEKQRLLVYQKSGEVFFLGNAWIDESFGGDA